MELSAARERALLDLVGEALPAAQIGWRDPRIGPAIAILGGFGDGYAVRSIEWTIPVPKGAVLDQAAIAEAVRRADLESW